MCVFEGNTPPCDDSLLKRIGKAIGYTALGAIAFPSALRIAEERNDGAYRIFPVLGYGGVSIASLRMAGDGDLYALYAFTSHGISLIHEFTREEIPVTQSEDPYL